MSKLLRFAFYVTIFILLLNPSLLFAFNNEDLYDASGIDSHRETLSSISEEHIDPFTGGLTLSNVDLTLPGNGGLDLVIQRTFNSKNVCNGWTCVGSSCSCSKGENTWLGYGWTLHFGRLFKSYNVNNKHFVEMPDGSMHAAYTKSGSTTFITKDYWLLDLGSSYVLTLTSGTKIYYGQNGPSNPKYPQHSVYYATKIQDVNGNEINIYYKSPGNIISYVIDSDGRRIDFATSTINGAVRLTSISGPGVSMSYTHQPLTALYDTILTKANLPMGNPWEYTYDSLELKSVKTPYGGAITYTYGFSQVIMGGSYLQYRTVLQKIVSGPDRDITAGTWTIAYSQGTNNEYTQISDPCGRTVKYSYSGYGSTYLPDGNMWKIGLPKTKEVVGEETINYDWTNSLSVSNDDYVMPTGHRDYYIYIPYLTKRAITRDGKTYATSYSNYDSYGNPTIISETGDKTRTTSITYWYNTTKNIVHNKPLSETVSGGFSGTFTTSYTYDGITGNLTQLNKYGVATNYSYYSNGNLYNMTDANSKKTTYVWNNGKISKITAPDNLYTIEREINDNGTIKWEKNGRGYYIYFTYDNNLRLTSIVPPAGNTTYFEYSTDNSYKNERRGEYYVYSYYDGFGRPSGTSDRKGIETDINYKSCGLKNYSTSNIGDTVYYDNFGRVTKILHKDSSDIKYTYSGSSVSVTDEDQKVTSLTYNAFGNPDEKLLVSVKDPLNNITSYDYNILGSIKSVTQGSVTRTFLYNTKTFLESETHPEKGTTSYARDNIGNMKSKTDSLGSTSYAYDGVNRLTNISYGLESIAFTHDSAGNRTSMDNANALMDYYYDPANRLIKKDEAILGKTYTTSYSYDANDNISDIYYPSGRHVTYTYNSNNQVISVAGFGANITGTAYYTSGVQIGLLKSFTYSTGLTTNLTYNSRNLTTQVKAGNSIIDMGYKYDNRGNMTFITDYRDSSKNQILSYDVLNRLLTFNGSWGSGSYIYNALGNRLSKQAAGATTYYNYSSNRLTSTTGAETFSFAYNTDGDLISMNAYFLQYDRLHNLINYKLSGSSLADFKYNGDGMRIIKTSGGKFVVYHYDNNGKVISETDSLGNLITDYIHLHDKLVAQVTDDVYIPPEKPTNLTSTVISSSHIDLSWTDNSNDETGFKIERKTGTGGAYTQIATVGSNVATYSDTGLTVNTTYYYRVRACNTSGDSGYSNEANATTSNVPPLAPTNLTASTISSSGINISWTDNSSDETGFKIERKTGSGGIYSQIATVGANVITIYSDTGLTSGTTYYYRVRAYNAAGDSVYSNEAYATTTGCSNLPVRIARAIPVYYSSLQVAYNAAVNGDIIQSRADITFTENISVNRNISVTLQGGYDCGYVTNSGNVSHLRGMIQTFVSGGTLMISNFNLIQ